MSELDPTGRDIQPIDGSLFPGLIPERYHQTIGNQILPQEELLTAAGNLRASERYHFKFTNEELAWMGVSLAATAAAVGWVIESEMGIWPFK